MISLAPLLYCSRLAAVQTQHNMDLWLANVSSLHARVKLHHQVYWREQVSARLIRCRTELNSANNRPIECCVCMAQNVKAAAFYRHTLKQHAFRRLRFFAVARRTVRRWMLRSKKYSVRVYFYQWRLTAHKER